MEAPLYSLCGFDGSAGSEMTMGHVFIWSVMAAVPFVGGGVEMKGLEQKPRRTWTFPMLSVHHCHKVTGWAGGARVLEQKKP